MHTYLQQLGPMLWPFIVISIFATAVILERTVVLTCAWLDVHKILTKKVDYQFSLLELAQISLQQKVMAWRKRLAFLSLVGTLSPLMGLFGTVWGLVVMFQSIAQSEQAVTPALLADGLWEAMYSTMAGLAIAMPCLLLYGLAQAVVERMQGELTIFINQTWHEKDAANA
ncbi:MotA/TolQ/ExbB proton channel family protein [Pseudoalteromonas sp.]|uniref:MotA/TolQ/ExbB proton channel family protein n=1 Tax=Pseudoalteromonas sp. TaxID=53249 RepID=UPI003567552A